MGSPKFKYLLDPIRIGRDANDAFITYKLKFPTTLYHKDRLAWCLFTLTEPSKSVTYLHSVLLQHFDYLIASKPKEKLRIDQNMYRCISDMVAVGTLLDLVALHRPAVPLHRREAIIKSFLKT